MEFFFSEDNEIMPGYRYRSKYQLGAGRPSLTLGSLALALGIWNGVLGGAEASQTATPAVFARVNGQEILEATYRAALRTGARQRFYHGRPPEAEVVEFRREIGERLVEERLLHQEALRRGIEPDSAWVDSELDKLVERYSSKPGWQTDNAELMASLKLGLEERSRIDQLEEELGAVAPPTEQQLESYYRSHTEAFTSPEQVRISTILLKVEPWAPSEVWEERKREAELIAERLRQGADFSELAREHSDDESAARGGDMGYQHRGMLGGQIEAVVDNMTQGEVSAPTVILEGVAIVRLDDRMPPRLNPLAMVRERAEGLWLRESRVRARTEAIAELRREAQVSFTDSAYFELDRQ